jgi:hypothetical protein
MMAPEDMVEFLKKERTLNNTSLWVSLLFLNWNFVSVVVFSVSVLMCFNFFNFLSFFIVENENCSIFQLWCCS